MPKLYITYNKNTNQNEYYVYKNTSSFISLKTEELTAYLTRVLESTITSARSIKDDLLEIVTSTEDIIVIDNPKAFSLDSDIGELIARIKTFIENTRIRTYKNSLPQNYIPKVNRSSKAKYIIESDLSGNLLLANPLGVEDSLTSNYDSEMRR